MKLDKCVWVVCDANGEFKGLFATEELANETAKFYGAYVTGTDTVHESLPAEVRKWRPMLGEHLDSVIDIIKRIDSASDRYGEDLVFMVVHRMNDYHYSERFVDAADMPAMRAFRVMRESDQFFLVRGVLGPQPKGYGEEDEPRERLTVEIPDALEKIASDSEAIGRNAMRLADKLRGEP